MLRTVVLVAALVIVTSPAHAQIVRVPNDESPSADLSIALALNGFKDVNVRPTCDALGLPCTSPKSFPDPGVTIAFAKNIIPSLALVLEGGVYRNVWESAATFQEPTEEVNTVLGFMLGPRVSKGIGDRVRIFGQVLVGARMSEMVEGSNAIQPGVGLDLATPAGVRVRFQLDYCIMRDPPPGPRSLTAARSLIGVVVPIGRLDRTRRLPPRPRW